MNLRPIVPPLIVLLVCWLAFAALLLFTSNELPDIVRNAYSRSDAVMSIASRKEYCLSILVFSLAFSAAAFGGGVLANALRWRISNIPHRDYWFAPERESATREFIARQFGWLGAGLVWPPAAIYLFTLSENTTGPNRYSTVAGVIIGALVVGFIAWMLHFYRHFLDGYPGNSDTVAPSGRRP